MSLNWLMICFYWHTGEHYGTGGLWGNWCVWMMHVHVWMMHVYVWMMHVHGCTQS